MGLPSKRRTSQSKKERNSHIKVKSQQGTSCAKCKKPVLPHQACKACGTYRGRQVIDTKKRAARTARKPKK